MQVINILRDDQHAPRHLSLKAGERFMRRIGLSVAGLGAARIIKALHKVRVAPVAFRRRHILDPVLIPEPARITKCAKPRFGGKPGAGENDDRHGRGSFTAPGFCDHILIARQPKAPFGRKPAPLRGLDETALIMDKARSAGAFAAGGFAYGRPDRGAQSEGGPKWPESAGNRRRRTRK